MFGEDGQENVPHREWLLMFEKIMNDVKDEMKNQGREDEFIGARVRKSFSQFCLVSLTVYIYMVV